MVLEEQSRYHITPAGLQLDRESVQKMIDDAVCPPRAEASTSYDALPGAGRLNLSGAEIADAESQKNKAKHKARHDEAQQKNKAREKEQLVQEKARKLKSSGAAREAGLNINDHAKNWAECETGEVKTGKSWGGGRLKRESGSLA